MQTGIKINRRPIFLIALIIILFPLSTGALEYDLRGQLSGWAIEDESDGVWRSRYGLRYIPQLTLEQPAGEDSFFDAEASLNGFLAGGDMDGGSDLELYRIKLRFSTPRTETRIGLQKINFGPALLLRPLRWFDRLDPSDPLQLTDGVYALRFRYSAMNNAGLWLWSLYGNDETKGYEILPTVSDRPEFGGRIQYPVPYGELAAAFHTRRVDASSQDGGAFTENRIAMDGRWDIVIGLWFESVLQHRNTNIFPDEYTKMITLGMDYTFGIGNGLYTLCEHMASVSSGRPASWGEDRQFSAFSLNYQVGYLDSMRAIGYYSWEQGKYYQYIGWNRTYDNLILNFNIFRYPDGGKNFAGTLRGGSGFGGQIMIIYNH